MRQAAPRIGLCNEVLGNRTFAEQCDIAARLGYDGLEVAPFTLAAEPHRLPVADRRVLRQTAADAGIAVTGLHWLLQTPAGLSITSRDRAQRERTKDFMRDLCNLCADLGGKALVHGSAANRLLEPGFENENRRVDGAHPGHDPASCRLVDGGNVPAGVLFFNFFKIFFHYDISPITF